MFCSFTFANTTRLTRTPWPTSPRRPYPPNSSDLKAPSFVRSSWMPSRLWRCGNVCFPPIRGSHIWNEPFWNPENPLVCEIFEIWTLRFFGYFGFAYFCWLFFLNQAVGIAQKVALLPWPPQTLQMVNLQGKAKYPVNQINVLKSHGQSSHESMLIPNGYAMQIMRASQDADAVECGNWRKISEIYWKDPEHTEDGACRVAVSDQEMPAWVSPAKIANASLQSLEFHDASVIRHSLHKFNLSCAKLLLHKLCCLLICFVLRKNWHRQIR